MFLFKLSGAGSGVEDSGPGNSPFFRPENMVHQMMATSISPAPRASSNSSVIGRLLWVFVLVVSVGLLAACGSAPQAVSGRVASVATEPAPARPAARPVASDVAGTLVQSKGRWVPVDWMELPGFADDSLFEAWNAWLRSCERPGGAFATLCVEVRRLSIGSAQEQRAWMQDRLQPFRVETMEGDATGLLTAYFEPVLQASRLPSANFSVPLYQPPNDLAYRKPWFTRQEMETLTPAQSALKGRTIAYVADPVDALILQIQGSGRLRITQPDGSQVWSRLSYGGTNDHPYRSVGRWLLEQGLVRDASWPAIKVWLANNPQRQKELLWINPRVTFFREEAMASPDAAEGPRGAQGIALTPGRSIAVDPASIPYGTPVWMASSGALVNLNKLVLAQDTGSAITGAVRADYFVGGGAEAGELAGRLRQPLQLWVLWPKQVR